MKRTPLRRTRLKFRSSAHAELMRIYNVRKKAYLEAHPWCQVSMSERCIDEDFCLRNGRITRLGLRVVTNDGSYIIPAATDIHHRNKRNGRRRLLDERWWMSTCRAQHDYIEEHKSYARNVGLLLNISANPDGFTPAGVQALTTAELLKSRAIPE